MRVLVTGHNGYIGPTLVSMLRQSGHDVVGVDTGFFEDCCFGAPPEPVPALRRDIRDITARDLIGVDAVVHLAALSNDPVGSLNERLTLEINYLASVQLARAAKEAGVERFVFSSSCSVYGAAGEEMVDEMSPLRPVTTYAASKARAEEALASLADASFTPVFLRSATAYGLSPRLRLDVVLNGMAFCGVVRGTVTVMNGGRQWRPIVHIADIAAAFVAALHAPSQDVSAQAFNVGAENYQVADIARIVAATIPGCRIESPADLGPDARSYRVDFAKIARVLPSCSPSWTANAGAVELVSALERLPAMAGQQAEDCQLNYFRLTQLQRLMRRGAVDSTLRWRTRAANVAEFDRARRRVA